MNSSFWQALIDADYAVPEGHTPHDLALALMGSLGSTDPLLRDDFAYGILVRWIDRAILTPVDLHPLIAPLVANLGQDLGQPQSDTVFLRSFSALMLAAIVYYDNHRAPFLTEGEVHDLLATALGYLAAEHDVRGYVGSQGWAHSVAHTADLLDELALSRYATPDDLQHMLAGIGRKLTTTPQLLLFNEDDRLSYAVLSVLKRELLAPEAVQSWAAGLGELPATLGRADTFSNPASQAAYLNTRSFLRSLALRLLDEALPSGVRACGPLILAALEKF